MFVFFVFEQKKFIQTQTKITIKGNEIVHVGQLARPVDN